MKIYKVKKYIVIPILIVLMAIVFILGFSLGKVSQPSIEKIHTLSNKELGQPTTTDFTLFWDVWHLVEKEYVDRANLDSQEMVYGAISGLLESLDDPYSVFMPPQESKQFLEDIKGSFGGIGAEVGIRKGILTVIAPLEGNPAQRAGLKAGDKILRVDDTLTADLTLDESVRLIRGEKGTEVTLLISRDSWEKTQEIKIIRDEIKIPIFQWEMKEGNIAYVEFYHFTENSTKEFEKIVYQILQENPNGLILDLRNNPGGYLEVAVDISSWFIPKGEPVVTEYFGNGEENKVHRSLGYEVLGDMETVVLINEGSASAAEILAGALRDHKGVKIVGKKSFGKGSVQQLQKIRGGSSVKLTIAKWLTPSGACIDQEGITPDVEVEFTEEDIDAMRDPQLEKALEMFNNAD